MPNINSREQVIIVVETITSFLGKRYLRGLPRLRFLKRGKLGNLGNLILVIARVILPITKRRVSERLIRPISS